MRVLGPIVTEYTCISTNVFVCEWLSFITSITGYGSSRNVAVHRLYMLNNITTYMYVAKWNTQIWNMTRWGFCGPYAFWWHYVPLEIKWHWIFIKSNKLPIHCQLTINVTSMGVLGTITYMNHISLTHKRETDTGHKLVHAIYHVIWMNSPWLPNAKDCSPALFTNDLGPLFLVDTIRPYNYWLHWCFSRIRE